MPSNTCSLLSILSVAVLTLGVVAYEQSRRIASIHGQMKMLSARAGRDGPMRQLRQRDLTTETSCLSEPSSPDCADYVYPDTSSDVSMICEMQPWESGCEIKRMCDSGSLCGDYCQEFSILADLCNTNTGETLGGVMHACDNYRSMCEPGNGTVTAIKACSTYSFVPELVTREDAVEKVRDMCASMGGMSGCSTCTSSSEADCAHPLISLSENCISMPGMSQCSTFKSMCQGLTNEFESLCGSFVGKGGAFCEGVSEPYCQGSGTDMSMSGMIWIPKGSNPCILFFFSDWKIDSDLKLAMAVIGSFLLGCCNGLVFVARQHLAAVFAKKRDLSPRLLFGLNFFCIFIQLSLAYILMLIAMTYVGILFVSTVAGLAFGHVVFRERRRRGNGASSLAELESCCDSPALSSVDDGIKHYVPLLQGAAGDIVLAVDGMTCNACVTTVRNALSKMQGVGEVRIDLVKDGTSTVSIFFEGGDKGNAIRASDAADAIEALGYEAGLKN